MAANKTVILRGNPNIIDEFKAAGVITPGDLIEKTATAGEVQRHGTASVNAAKLFAIERDELGNDIDDDYAANDQVKVAAVAAGDEVNALVADGTTVTEGDFVDSAGDGTVKALTTSAATADTARASVVGQALETSAPVGAKGRVRILIV